MLKSDKSKQNVTSVSDCDEEVLGSENSEATADKPESILDKMLKNNPGNFKRKRAVTVDMTEFESIRRQLEQHHAEQV